MPTEVYPTTTEAILLSEPFFLFWSISVFLFGMLIGSFLNVAIYRLPFGMSVNDPKRSFCFRCGTQIKWYDNIPLFSYFLLGGRDRACGAKYSFRYAAVELLTGLLFLIVWVTNNSAGEGGFSPVTIWYLAFISFLIIGTFTDLDHWILPRSIPRLGVAGALVAALLAGFFDKESMIARAGPFPALIDQHPDALERFVSVFMGPNYYAMTSPEIAWWMPLANSIVGLIVAPLIIWLVGFFGTIILRKDAMGFGDVELFAMIGATVGASNSAIVLVFACFFGAIFGMTRIVLAKMSPVESPLGLGELDEHEVRDLLRPPMLLEPVSGDALESAKGFAESLEMEFLDLSEDGVAERLPANNGVDLISSALVLESGDDGVTLAVADPMNTENVTVWRERFGENLEFRIVDPAQLESAVTHLRSAGNEGEETPLWKRYYDVASVQPIPKTTGHLPFIPPIAAACLVVVVWETGLLDLYEYFFQPAFAY